MDLVVAELVKKFAANYGIQMFIAAFRGDPGPFPKPPTSRSSK
jgi:hypothetical protein